MRQALFIGARHTRWWRIDSLAYTRSATSAGVFSTYRSRTEVSACQAMSPGRTFDKTFFLHRIDFLRASTFYFSFSRTKSSPISILMRLANIDLDET